MLRTEKEFMLGIWDCKYKTVLTVNIKQFLLNTFLPPTLVHTTMHHYYGLQKKVLYRYNSWLQCYITLYWLSIKCHIFKSSKTTRENINLWHTLNEIQCVITLKSTSILFLLCVYLIFLPNNCWWNIKNCCETLN